MEVGKLLLLSPEVMVPMVPNDSQNKLEMCVGNQPDSGL
jgi:hypothetical protein